jgi:hypothetical protein
MECRVLLTELAALWDGRIFNPPSRSDDARRLEVELTRIREFLFMRVSSDERRIALLPDHRIGPGREHERYWYVADGTNGLELRIEGDGLRSCALRRSDDGTWRGRLSQPPGMPVELISTGAGDTAKTPDPDRDGGTLMELLDRVLNLSASLPWDNEVARDLSGALRILAVLDPAVIERLQDEERRRPGASARGRAIRAAFGELAVRGAIAPGTNWLNGHTKLGPGYERV